MCPRTQTVDQKVSIGLVVPCLGMLEWSTWQPNVHLGLFKHLSRVHGCLVLTPLKKFGFSSSRSSFPASLSHLEKCCPVLFLAADRALFDPTPLLPVCVFVFQGPYTVALLFVYPNVALALVSIQCILEYIAVFFGVFVQLS
jgi:hypothetical protein